MAWVTDSPHWLNHRTTSLTYRMLSSMQGSLGIGANIATGHDEEAATAKRLIAAYHQVQPTIVQGELYRLISPLNGSEFSATQTVNQRQEPVGGLRFHPLHAGRARVSRSEAEGAGPGCGVHAHVDRGQGAGGNAGDGQRGVVDEPWAGDGRKLPRRFSGGGVSTGSEIRLFAEVSLLIPR